MTELYTKKVLSPQDAHDAGLNLALTVATEKLGFTPEITYTENGKPCIDGLHFNISHSGELVICVFADREVGADVEKIRDHPTRVVKKIPPG